MRHDEKDLKRPDEREKGRDGMMMADGWMEQERFNQEQGGR